MADSRERDLPLRRLRPLPDEVPAIVVTVSTDGTVTVDHVRSKTANREGCPRIFDRLSRSTSAQGNQSRRSRPMRPRKPLTVWDDRLAAILPLTGTLAAFIILTAI